MSASLRKSITDLTRRRARTIFTVLTLAIAVASVSFFAIPTVIDRTLQEEVRAGRLADVTVSMRPLVLTAEHLTALLALPNVAAVEPRSRVETRVLVGERRSPARVIGVRDFGAQQVDVVRVESGAFPGQGEVRLVYVTAFVPEPGRSIADLAGAEARATILAVSRDDGDGCRSFDLELLASIVPPEQREAYLAFLEATQRPQGWAAMEQPWPGRSLPDVPCSYVLCTEDTILPPATQRELAARLGAEPVELASDHAVFALRPRELAPLLVG